MRRAALGVVVICLLAEALLRIDPVLPSMSAQMNPFRPSARPAVVAQGPEIPGCVESDTHGPPPTAWRWRVGDQVDEGIHIIHCPVGFIIKPVPETEEFLFPI